MSDSTEVSVAPIAQSQMSGASVNAANDYYVVNDLRNHAINLCITYMNRVGNLGPQEICEAYQAFYKVVKETA